MSATEPPAFKIRSIAAALPPLVLGSERYEALATRRLHSFINETTVQGVLSEVAFVPPYIQSFHLCYSCTTVKRMLERALGRT